MRHFSQIILQDLCFLRSFDGWPTHNDAGQKNHIKHNFALIKYHFSRRWPKSTKASFLSLSNTCRVWWLYKGFQLRWSQICNLKSFKKIQYDGNGILNSALFWMSFWKWHFTNPKNVLKWFFGQHHVLWVK